MDEKRNKGIYIKMTQAELDAIERGMESMGIRNRSGYIRKLAIDGYLVKLDFPELKEIGRILSITSNNVNQIAKKVNGGGGVCREDLAGLKAELEGIRLQFGQLLQSLAKLQEAV